jgi:SOS response regulatory protein OraA/RecX
MHAGPEPIAPIVMKKARLRWARLAREDDYRKRKSKLVQYLQRRGFAYAASVEILDRLMAEADGSQAPN